MEDKTNVIKWLFLIAFFLKKKKQKLFFTLLSSWHRHSVLSILSFNIRIIKKHTRISLRSKLITLIMKAEQ